MITECSGVINNARDNYPQARLIVGEKVRHALDNLLLFKEKVWMTIPIVERSADKLSMDLWMTLLNETRANIVQELDT
jgi:hypothetical protein